MRRCDKARPSQYGRPSATSRVISSLPARNQVDQLPRRPNVASIGPLHQFFGASINGGLDFRGQPRVDV